MIEPLRELDSALFRQLGEIATTTAAYNVALRDFLGRKVAREALDDLGFSNLLSESVISDFEDITGTMATTGLILSIKKTTEPEDVDYAVIRLTESLPLPMQNSFGKLVPVMVARGIAFHQSELKRHQSELREPSLKFTQWLNEFDLLRSAEL